MTTESGSHLLQHPHYKPEDTDLEGDLPAVPQQTCSRATVELNRPLLSPEISASSQPRAFSFLRAHLTLGVNFKPQ